MIYWKAMKIRSTCSGIFLMAFLLLTSFSMAFAQEQAVQPESNFGTLLVQSTPLNADVKLNGKFIGKTPLTIKPIAAGVHELTISLAGHSSYRTFVRIEAGRFHTIGAPLSAQIYTQWQEQYNMALISSILLPGKGQVDNGHKRGWVYFMSYISASYYGYYCSHRYNVANNNYSDQLDAYKNETDPEMATSRYRDLQGSLDKMDSYKNQFGYAIATMGVIWAVNMVDVIFFSVPRPMLMGDGNIKVTMDTSPGQFKAGLSFKF